MNPTDTAAPRADTAQAIWLEYLQLRVEYVESKLAAAPAPGDEETRRALPKARQALARLLESERREAHAWMTA